MTCDWPWRVVAGRAVDLAVKAAGPAARVRALGPGLPKDRHAVFYDPDEGAVHLGLAKGASDAAVAAWAAAGFDPAPLDVPPPGWGERPWVLVKRSADPFVGTAAALANLKPWAGNSVLGGPTPLAATLAGGLLGAGAGYGLGLATDDPDPYGESSRPLLGGALGGAVGAAPGLLWGLSSYTDHPELAGRLRALASAWPHRRRDREKAAAPDGPLGQGVGLLSSLPRIDRAGWEHDVWRDRYTPPAIRAAAVGLVNAASYAAGRSPFVSPWDVARVADDPHAGLVVGQAIGAMHGCGPAAKDDLRRTGVWAGVLTRVVPHAFPDSRRLFS